MENIKMLNYIKDVLENIPTEWLNLTTHRLDIYNESLAKSQFLDQFELLCNDNNSESSALNELPTAFDYIRLGHPLSCILEWGLAKLNDLSPNNVISFSSKTIPLLAILRTNLLNNKNTLIIHTGDLPDFIDIQTLKSIYGYTFELKKIESKDDIPAFNGSTVFISQDNEFYNFEINPAVDFFISIHTDLGSMLFVNGTHNESYISEIQHVRRRETIAMTPSNSLTALNELTKKSQVNQTFNSEADKISVLDSIKEITGTTTNALIASSGLSIQYAILMGLIHDALENHKGQKIKIIVPPNCYGGTNDQARRIAACIDLVEVLDLPVDGGKDMVQSIDVVLEKIAHEDAIPYIIAEIPTNPRVEVPNLLNLKKVLSMPRQTATGKIAVDPVFILDQTFCPNVYFLGEGEVLSTVRAISYASGSKFPSGGLCTAGYCTSNKKAELLMEKIALHLRLCDNEATFLQMELLAKQLPSMKQRIYDAYKNTREFVNHIKATLPEAKINFVSEELASKGFTPSVFSLDLPTKGNSRRKRNV